MFKKVLIAEDHESASISVQKTLEKLGVQEPEYVYYCDDALNYIRRALQRETPYELLITDLYFEKDHYAQQLPDGKALIQAARELQPGLKVIVFSAESRPAVVNGLFKALSVDGYVRKARRDAEHLLEALQMVYANRIYCSPDMKPGEQQHFHEFTSFDTTIISLLAEGLLQKDIPYYLRQNNIKPSGLSSVEKRLSLIREKLGFSKNEQLIAYCKDIGII